MLIKKGLGWIPQRPDHRDLVYTAPMSIMMNLPPHVDLASTLPACYDQGELGSCTGNAIAGAMQFERIKQKLAGATQIPSRLMIYYDERVIENTINSDAGAMIRDGIKSVAVQGACFEDGPDGWPYDVAKFAVKPPQNCYTAALRDRAIQYTAPAQSVRQLRGCLAAGYPFIFGFTCYEALVSAVVATTGILPMPKPNDASIGGHAVLAVGYDDRSRMFKIRNSWGPAWGLNGYFWMPFEYVTRTDLSSDFWTIRLISA